MHNPRTLGIKSVRVSKARGDINQDLHLYKDARIGLGDGAQVRWSDEKNDTQCERDARMEKAATRMEAKEGEAPRLRKC